MGLALERKTFSIFNAVDNRFPILQDQIPRMRTVCGGEECNIVAAATAYIYKQGLRYFNMGGAAAASWLFLLAVIAFSLVMIRVRGRMGRTA